MSPLSLSSLVFAFGFKGPVCGGVGVLIFLILCLCSIHVLKPDEYGLDYSWMSQKIKSKDAYGPGWHFLGLFHSFKRFPKTLQTIEFTSNTRTSSINKLKSRTNDGLEVALEISFQYTLNQEEVYDLYMAYQSHYETIFERIAVNVLTTSTTDYSAYDYFKKRIQISNDFFDDLNKVYNQKCFSTIKFFQLRSIDLPDEFELSIQDTEINKQKINFAQAKFNAELVSFETEFLKAQYAANVTKNIAQGTSNATIVMGNATAESFKLVQNRQGQGLHLVKENLGMSNAELLEFMKTRAIRDHEGDEMLVAIDGI